MTHIQKDIEAILGECVGEDVVVENDIQDEEYANEAYNEALSHVRSRIPETARKVLDMVREAVEKAITPLDSWKLCNKIAHPDCDEGICMLCGFNPELLKKHIIASLAGEDEPVSPQRKLSIPVSYKGQQYVTDGKDIYLWPSMERLAGEDEGDKCVASNVVLMCNPPKYQCKTCGQTWYSGTDVPVCKGLPANDTDHEHK